MVVSGVQSTISGTHNDGGIAANPSASYDTLKLLMVETGSPRFDANTTTDFALRNAADKDYQNGFKKSSLYTERAGYLNRVFNHTSTYKNFDDQMQIGHVYGDLKTTKVAGIRLDTLSNVYVQGNSTDLADMQYRKDLAKYNTDNQINDGKVVYRGDATYMGNSTNKIVGADPILGKSDFNVDFVANKVDGNLTFTGTSVSDKKITAQITGNKFAGNANGVDTKGGFYGEDAELLGGVYQVADGKGTYGAGIVDTTVPDPTEKQMTGFQSTALSSKKKTLPFGAGELENAIGYVGIRDDKSAWTETTTENGSVVPVDNRQGDNFTSFDTGVVLGDMVKPETVVVPIGGKRPAGKTDYGKLDLTKSGSIKVDAGKSEFLNPTLNYNAVYKNFDQQMQVGHIYGNLDSRAGEISRVANVYVQGYLTTLAAMDGLKQVNGGKAQYTGDATYMENIHFDDNASTAPVNGTSAFDADFVSGKLDGKLSFAPGTYKYMPTGNQININADITGNTFAGNNGIDTAGGFYGKDAQFLGGVYQDTILGQGGKGTVAGTGTRFQGTYGATKK